MDKLTLLIEEIKNDYLLDFIDYIQLNNRDIKGCIALYEKFKNKNNIQNVIEIVNDQPKTIIQTEVIVNDTSLTINNTYNNQKSHCPSQCQYMFKRGNNIGKQCTIGVKSGGMYCSKHKKIMEENQKLKDIKDTDVKKDLSDVVEEFIDVIETDGHEADDEVFYDENSIEYEDEYTNDVSELEDVYSE